MSSKTGIPEFVVGAIATVVSVWLFPSVSTIQTFALSEYYRSVVDTSSMQYMSLTLSAASCVLAIGAFVLIAAYCDCICIEKLYYWWKARRQ